MKGRVEHDIAAFIQADVFIQIAQVCILSRGTDDEIGLNLPEIIGVELGHKAVLVVEYTQAALQYQLAQLFILSDKTASKLEL